MKSSDLILLLLAIALVIGMILTALLGSRHGYGSVDYGNIYGSIQQTGEIP